MGMRSYVPLIGRVERYRLRAIIFCSQNHTPGIYATVRLYARLFIYDTGMTRCTGACSQVNCNHKRLLKAQSVNNECSQTIYIYNFCRKYCIHSNRSVHRAPPVSVKYISAEICREDHRVTATLHQISVTGNPPSIWLLKDEQLSLQISPLCTHTSGRENIPRKLSVRPARYLPYDVYMPQYV